MTTMGWGRRSAIAVTLLAAALVAGCGNSGGTSSSGAFQVAFTDERLVSSNQCAVRGNATNGGNVRAQVNLTYEALNGSGAVIGTATASFQVSGFSNFEFTTGSFSNGLSCAAIADFRRSVTDIHDA
jgi:hypothetical protein